ncbi:hypothetical protein E2C01_027237 [Portunus trituberculatus]|uniref:Uncharacterized protein n=1 Tax=Portunus trituberculatus TaxID=210409 RepID=A0A5B7EHN4_PORTR|nr:hypothetical protein [Portunus trituberculatus]
MMGIMRWLGLIPYQFSYEAPAATFSSAFLAYSLGLIMTLGTQQTSTATHSTSRFATPLPSALAETSNMVINDMTSSLTSLQEENKYLQLIQ